MILSFTDNSGFKVCITYSSIESYTTGYRSLIVRTKSGKEYLISCKDENEVKILLTSFAEDFHQYLHTELQ